MKYKLNFIVCSLLLLFVGTSFCQEIQVSGVVTDKNGVPLPGVNIVVEGSTQGTNTDFDGRYSFNVNYGQVLVFSFVGFEEHTEKVEDSTTINVQLLESSNQLEQVIVTAFGREQTRNELTASVSSISSEDLVKIPQADARGALMGKVPGVLMSETTGAPGAEPEIRIRGINSVTASNDPLYVVDGVPINSGNVGVQNFDGGITRMSSVGLFSLLDPADIENISILKDASAVAPYGADAANGVLLITTKSGSHSKLGKIQFSFDSYIGIQNDAVKGFEPINADDRLTAMKESIWNTYGTDFGNGVITSRDQIEDFYTQNFGDAITQWREVGKGKNYSWKDFYRNKNALTTNIHFSMSKRSEDSNFFASVGYNKTEGTVIGTDFQRLTGFINYGLDISPKIHFNISANVGNVNQGAIDEAGSVLQFYNPNYMGVATSSWVPPYLEDGSLNYQGVKEQVGKYNLLFTDENDIKINDVTRALQNTQLTYDILDNLQFKTILGLDYTISYYKEFLNMIHGGGENNHGSDSETSQRLFNYTTQNSLDYSFRLGEDHKFDIMALQEYTKYKSFGLQGSGQNFPKPGLNNLSSSSSNWRSNSVFSDQWTMRYVGLLNYSLKDRYILNASFSHQGDTRFNKRWGDFYSVGAAWNIHEENFIKNNDFINLLKYKIGYGLTGNAGISRNQYQELFSYGSYRGNAAANILTYGSSASWEKSKRFDTGIELESLNGRLSASISYYLNRTTDMLLNVPIPYSSGFIDGTVVENFGEMENSGFEIEFGFVPIRTTDFRWDIAANISTLKNRVKSLPNRIVNQENAIEAGHMIFEWYMPEWAGVDPDNGLPLWYVDRKINDDITGDYTKAKKNYQGKNGLPKYFGSLSSYFEFKNFFVDVSLIFSGGNQVYEFKNYIFDTTEGSDLQPHNATQRVFDGAWFKPGDIAEFPRWDYSNPEVGNAINTSTHFLFDDDYMRVRDLTVGYKFQHGLISKIGLENLTISLKSKNLWTWMKDKNLKYDPVMSSTGYTGVTIPPVKSFIFNINLKF